MKRRQSKSPERKFKYKQPPNVVDLKQGLEMCGAELCETGFYHCEARNGFVAAPQERYDALHNECEAWQLNQCLIFLANNTTCSRKGEVNSFQMKHRVETNIREQQRGFQITNGIAILACMLAGLPYRKLGNNAMVCVEIVEPCELFGWSRESQLFGRDCAWASTDAKTCASKLCESSLMTAKFPTMLMKVILEYNDLSFIEMEDYRWKSLDLASQLGPLAYQQSDCSRKRSSLDISWA